MTQIECRDLSLGYGPNTLVSGLSFSVEAGDCLCVVGENGSGKSTLMRTILGLQPPQGGSVAWAPGLRRGIGYLPQQAAAQGDFPASAWEVALSGCQGRCGLRPFYGGAERRLASRALRRLGVEGLSGRCYRDLSGGQRQRVLLARALCAARSVLLLDEPAAGLDPESALEMYRVVGELGREGVTVVMITHDLTPALERATHVLRLSPTPFFGTVDQYRQRWGDAA